MINDIKKSDNLSKCDNHTLSFNPISLLHNIDTTHLTPFSVTINDWTNIIVDEEGRPDFFCIALLGDLFGWFRNLSVKKMDYSDNKLPRIKDNQLVLSYEYLVSRFRVSREKIRKGFVKLESLGVLSRKVKNVKLAEGSRINQLYLTIDKNFYSSCFRNPELDVTTKNNFEDIRDSAPLKRGDPISKKELKEKDRSTKSNFLQNSILKEGKGEVSLQTPTSSQPLLKAPDKQLKDFYPLSESDVRSLQSLSGREFSLNAMNEILLDMSKRVKNRWFKSKKGFLSYMSMAFKYEMRDAVKVSNIDFKIKSNQSPEEIAIRQQEDFLNEIESNYQNSPEWLLKKKLCSVFEREKAYNLLKSYKHCTLESNIFKLYLHKHIELTKEDSEIILEKIMLTYEEVDHTLKLEIIMPDLCLKPNLNSKMGQGITGCVSKVSTEPMGIWNKIRKTLVSHYGDAGEAIDALWISNLEAIENKQTKEIILKSPNKFITDRIKDNFFDIIKRITDSYHYQISLG